MVKEQHVDGRVKGRIEWANKRIKQCWVGFKIHRDKMLKQRENVDSGVVEANENAAKE